MLVGITLPHRYTCKKQKMCAEVGIRSFGHTLPADASQSEVEALVRQLNADPEVDGILVTAFARASERRARLERD